MPRHHAPFHRACLALLVLLALTLGPPARPALARALDPSGQTVRQAWLLFPLDLRAYRGVSSEYGPRRIYGHRELHGGVDLRAPVGSAVVAARHGRVARIGYDRRAGWYVCLEHEQGWQTIYCHLRVDPRKAGLFVGQRVAAGQVIGQVGMTGRTTGPHLHFGVKDPRGTHRDPLMHLFTPAETLAILQRWTRPARLGRS
jgi:murein DD-endopeptidase MepM/ murein hydrolase activator NlpD